MGIRIPVAGIIFLLIFFISFSCVAQPSGGTPASDSLKKFYLEQIGDRSFLYTGDEYRPHRLGIKGSPFLGSLEMQKATLNYNGVTYPDIPVLYDLVRQKIVINRYKSNARMSLVNEKLESFQIDNRLFRSVGSNFLEVLFEGDQGVYARRQKVIMTPANPEEPLRFDERDIFYLGNAMSLSEVNDKKSVLNHFTDHKEALKTYVRKQRLRFKNDFAKDLVKLATYYTTLN